MAFPIPSFPLLASWWQAPNTPALGPANVLNIPMQKYIDVRGGYQIPNFTAPFTNPYPATWLKTPAGVLIFPRLDIIEANTGSGEYYKVGYREVFYEGFPQVFLGLLVWQCNANGTVPRTY